MSNPTGKNQYTGDYRTSGSGQTMKSLQLIGVMVLLVGVAALTGGVNSAWPSLAILVGSLAYAFGRIAVWMAKE